MVENRLTTGAAIPRPKVMTPEVMSRIKMALSLTLRSSTSTHWLMKSSEVAVPNMAMVMMINNGFNSARYISLSETELATRSVTGNSRRSI